MKRIFDFLKMKISSGPFLSLGGRLMLVLFAALLLLSCENTELPVRALQANLNGNLFRAYSVEAFADNETQMIRIEATSDSEKFILQTQWQGENVYNIGLNERNFAMFKAVDGTLLSTETYGSSGAITITNFNEDRQEFSGDFNFTFVTATDTINVSQGIFHSVPYMILENLDQ